MAQSQHLRSYMSPSPLHSDCCSRQYQQRRPPSVRAGLEDTSADANGNGRHRGDRLKAAANGKREPFVRRFGSSHQKDDALPLSLYTPFQKLPPDGKTRTEEEELCDPYERSCQTPIHVWESKCRACQGTGSVRSMGRRRSHAATCLLCHGLGFVRRTSSRVLPNLNGGSGPDLTLGRPEEDPDGVFLVWESSRGQAPPP